MDCKALLVYLCALSVVIFICQDLSSWARFTVYIEIVYLKFSCFPGDIQQKQTLFSFNEIPSAAELLSLLMGRNDTCF